MSKEQALAIFNYWLQNMRLFKRQVNNTGVLRVRTLGLTITPGEFSIDFTEHQIAIENQETIEFLSRLIKAERHEPRN